MTASSSCGVNSDMANPEDEYSDRKWKSRREEGTNVTVSFGMEGREGGRSEM